MRQRHPLCGKVYVRAQYDKKEKIRVETLAGIIIPELIIENGMVESVRVDMGEPRLERSEIPMLGRPDRLWASPWQWAA